MVKRCRFEGCTKQAQDNTNFCKAHGGGPRCQHDGCTKSAASPSDFCANHGGGSRCQFEGCTKSAQGSSDFCKAHGGGRRCQFEGCTKSAQGKSNLCITHGGGPRCQFIGCTKSARSPSDFCIVHGGGHRCQFKSCTKSAIQPSDFCANHGGGPRCPNCIDWLDSRCGCKKYRGYCATCFKHLFPSDPLSTKLRIKSAEVAVGNYLKEIGFNFFIHDQPIHTNHCDCSHRRRIDYRHLIGNTMIAVEVDENQHKLYDQQNEDDRINDLYMVHSGKWLFIHTLQSRPIYY